MDNVARLIYFVRARVLSFAYAKSVTGKIPAYLLCEIKPELEISTFSGTVCSVKGPSPVGSSRLELVWALGIASPRSRNVGG